MDKYELAMPKVVEIVSTYIKTRARKKMFILILTPSSNFTSNAKTNVKLKI